MEKNESNISEERKQNDNLERSYEEREEKEKRFCEEEVCEMIKDGLGRKKRNVNKV
ncbi:hypothetical protein [Staphylococcus epidermidis]|uniref:hypothetical protein n=1 Tax=Staphylococcus epidermidis TaxID=1282 RepID=UPI0016423E64|nr:hypothetical protein [Staphylococcus epidermidis]